MEYVGNTPENIKQQLDSAPVGEGIVGGIAQAAATIFSTLYNANQAKKAQDRALRYDKELSQYNYDLELEQWNRANEYNTPEAQMERYRAAGLNPNLIYSQSNAAANNAPTAGGNASSGSGNYVPMEPMALVDAYTRLQQLNLANRQTEADVRYKDNLGKSALAQAVLTGLQGKEVEARLPFVGETARYQRDELRQKIQNMETENQKMTYEIEKLMPTQWEQMKEQLKQAQIDNETRAERNRAEISAIYQQINTGQANEKEAYERIKKLQSETDGIIKQNAWIDRINLRSTAKLAYEAEQAMYNKDIAEINRDYAEEEAKARLYDRGISGSTSTHVNSSTWVHYTHDIMDGAGKKQRKNHRSGIDWKNYSNRHF